ncbi:MAG: methylenetetrahydrofolate--tRNA-(uracil(54)-C(5))-methyltransferase (FADH(2)-oxidizing) TrmFO [Myxococcales bacterium]|nr:methylenetetrahydrofolate--tRNA-(uracil(54)-C(5))-methyltransferase (FADH(2)-oxidizing) TrmFO [Myxococcales bacterium]
MVVESGFLPDVVVIGGGLAGCESAYQIARGGFRVIIYEMRPIRTSEAHKTDKLAELVCSNSFRSNNPDNAVGLIKREMDAVGSVILRAAKNNAVPAGDALAMDRERFSHDVTTTITQHPNIRVVRQHVTQLEQPLPTIVATGPLTSDVLANQIVSLLGAESLYFYDAIAPIVDADSIDLSVIFAQSRWDKGDGADYLNCPMDRERYERFVSELVAAEKVPLREFEKPKYFPGCLPIEVIAESGPRSLAFGPMKPVGLVDPATGRRPYAVVQLRQENRDATAYNLVGFQTKLKYPEQKRIFSLIPGLERAEFLRFGSVHRNTYIHGPRWLDSQFRLKTREQLTFAGQITGVEGYVESTASGMLAGLFTLARLRGTQLPPPPRETALGSLHHHVTVMENNDYQPTNVNHGLFPALDEKKRKQDKKAAYRDRAEQALIPWLEIVRSIVGRPSWNEAVD